MEVAPFYPIFVAQYRGVEQLVARRAHNPKVTGSSPVSATKKTVNANKTGIYGLCRKDSRDTNGTQHENPGIYFETAQYLFNPYLFCFTYISVTGCFSLYPYNKRIVVVRGEKFKCSNTILICFN